MNETNASDTYECIHLHSESDSLICLKCYLEPKVSVTEHVEKNLEDGSSSNSCCEAIAEAKALGFLPTRFRSRRNVG